MAEREASIKVTLKEAGFMAGLRGLEIEGEKTAARMGYKMGSALRGPMVSGVKSAKAALSNMAKTASGHIKTMATLGGAFAIGKFVSDALSMQTVYRDIAHQVGKITGQSEDWRSMMRMIVPVADETGQKVTDMAGAFKTIVSATGDVKYTQDQLKVIGNIATASGKDVALLAVVAEKVNRKFGLTGKAASDAIAMIASQTDIGGPALEAFGSMFDIMASEATIAGMRGAEGLGQLVGIMNKLDAMIGVEAPGALKEMFKAFDKNAPQVRALQKIRVGFAFDEEQDFVSRLRSVMADPKLFASMEQTITGPAKRAFRGLTTPYREAFRNAVKEGKSVKEATEIALQAYDKFVSELNQSGKTVSQYTREAKDRMKDDPSVIMRKALNKMAVAFQDPKMLNALTKLAKLLPDVADKFVWLMDKLARHPFLTAGAAVGTKVALSFASGALAKAGVSIGTAAAMTIRTKAVALGAWKTAGAALGIAGAAYLVYKLGEAEIDKLFDKRAKEQKSAVERDIEATQVARKGSVEEKKATLARMRTEHKKLKGEAPGFAEKAFAVGAHIWTGGETPIDTHADTVARSAKSIRDLEESIKKQETAQRNSTRQTSQMGSAAGLCSVEVDKLEKNLSRLNKAITEKGPPRPPKPAPGQDPPGPP